MNAEHNTSWYGPTLAILATGPDTVASHRPSSKAYCATANEPDRLADLTMTVVGTHTAMCSLRR